MADSILPPWLQNISSYLMQNPMALIDPIGSTARHFIETEDEARANSLATHFPADAIAQQAMIPTRRNIATFLANVMKSKVPAETLKKYPELGTALSIAETRYPMHSANTLKYGDVEISARPQDQASGYAGWFSPRSSNITIVAKPKSPFSSTYDEIKDYMNTALHEMAHSDQYNRASSKFTKAEMLTPNQHPEGKYITSEASRQHVGNNSLYRNQPVEVDAFRRGDVASKAIQELGKLLPEVNKRIPFDKAVTEPNQAMENLASFFNRAIKQANKSFVDPEMRSTAINNIKGKKELMLDHIRSLMNQGELPKEPLNVSQHFFVDDAIIPSAIVNRDLAARAIPTAEFSPRDLQFRNLIRQVQAAKGVGPLQEWLRKSMTIERYADKMPGGLLRHMDELTNSYKGSK